MRFSFRQCGTLLFVLSLLASSCSDAVEAPQGLTGEFTIVGALAEIPESATNLGTEIHVSVADLDAIADRANLQRRECCDYRNAAFEFFAPMTIPVRDGPPLAGVYVALPRWMTSFGLIDPLPMREEFGFWPGEIGRFVHLEMQPAPFTVVTGVTLPDGLPEVAPNVGTIGEGEDFENDIPGRTVMRSTGTPVRVARRGDQVALSLRTEPVADWVSDTPGPTLADDPVLLTLAEHLDEYDIESASLFARNDSWVFSGVALGWATDQDGPLGIIGLNYATAEMAADQLAAVEAAFTSFSDLAAGSVSELITLDTIEVRQSTIVAVVRYQPDVHPMMLMQLFRDQDGPFA